VRESGRTPLLISSVELPAEMEEIAELQQNFNTSSHIYLRKIQMDLDKGSRKHSEEHAVNRFMYYQSLERLTPWNMQVYLDCGEEAD